MTFDASLHYFGLQKPVFARSGWEIPQENPLLIKEKRRTTDLVRNRTYALIEEMRKNGKSNLIVRSVSSRMYDCVGMIFANRRTWINVTRIYKILDEDGYYEISRAQLHVADIVVYTMGNEPKHVGLVTHVYPSLGTLDNVRVLSKWGFEGEVEHGLDDVPMWCGSPTAYFSERVP